MKITQILANASSDNLLLESVASYFDSRTQEAIDAVEKLTDIIANHDDPSFVLPQLIQSIPYSLNDVVYVIDHSSLVNALIDDVDQFYDLVNGINVNVDDLITQIQQSVMANKIIVEGCKTLLDSGAKSITSITTEFINRVQLALGEITDDVSEVASKIMSILTTPGSSIGTRVKAILQYAGFFNIPDETQPDIGIPECDMSQINGVNVYQAWFMSVPDSLLEFGEWLVDTGKKVLKLLENVTEVVMGSGVYRSIKKIINTLTLEADSFIYNSGTEFSRSIDNYGCSIKLANLPYSDESLSNVTDYIDILKAIYSFTNVEYDISKTILYNLRTLVELVENPSTLGPCRLHDFIDYTTTLPQVSMPVDIALNMHWVKNKLLGLSIRLYAVLGSRLLQSYPIDSNINTYLQLSLGSIMDYYHINAEDDWTLHLYSNSYLKVDLPFSTLYLWLVGSDLYITRRVVPCTFTPVPADQLAQYLINLLEPYTVSNNGVDQHFINIVKLNEVISQARTSSDSYVTADDEMIHDVYAAHLFDSLYLMMLGAYYDMDIDPDQEITYLQIPNSYGVVWGSVPSDPIGFTIQAMNKFFSVLTGYNQRDFNVEYIPQEPIAITNRTLALSLGAGSIRELDFVTSIFASSIKFILNSINNSELFIPYAHVASIDYGRYKVATDSQLKDVFVSVLQVVAVIAAVLLTIKAVKTLKKRALAARTKADANAWELVAKDKYTSSAINEQYKLLRRAERCEKLASALFNSTTRVIKGVYTSLSSTIGTMVSQVSTRISGNKSLPGSDAVINVSDIYKVITGRN